MLCGMLLELGLSKVPSCVDSGYIVRNTTAVTCVLLGAVSQEARDVAMSHDEGI